MKKNKTISLSLIITMLLLPFVNTIDVSGAPPPSYVGVSEGDVLSWEIDFDGTGIEDMVNDVHTVANELMTFIADDTSTGLEDFIEQFFPNTILDKNLSAGVVEFLENLTSASILPQDWVDMNVPDIITNMINATIPPGILPAGWLDTINCTDFIGSLLELALGGLPNWNQSWTGFNVTALLDLIFETVVDPTGYFEPGWLDSYNLIEMFDMLLLNLTRAFENVSFLNGWTDFNFTTLILNVLENITAPVMPAGWLDMDIESVVNSMLDSGILTSACMDLNISECIGYIIANLTSGILPAGWMDLSFTELLDNSLVLLENVTDPDMLELFESMLDLILSSLETYLDAMGSMLSMGGPTMIEIAPLFLLHIFQDYSIQEILNSYILQMGRSSQYMSSVNINEIVGSYGIKFNETSFSDDWIGATLQIYNQFSNLVGTFTVTSPIIILAPDCTLFVDSTGLTQTLSEMGIDNTHTFNIMRLVETPIKGLTMEELLNSSLDLVLPTMPFTLPVIGGGAITSVENGTHFSIGPNPENQSWVGGVVYIMSSVFVYEPVTSVTDNGTHLIVGINSLYNLTDYVNPGYSAMFYNGPLNLKTASIRNIIVEMSNFVFLNAGSFSISDFIDWALTELNTTVMPYLAMFYGLDYGGDFLSLSVRESINFVLEFFNKLLLNPPVGLPIAMGLTILEITGDFNFTVTSSLTNDTWVDGSVAIYSGMMGPTPYFKVTNVIDNGVNVTVVIEDQTYTLTEMGYGWGNSTTFYGPSYLSLEELFGIKKDMFNVTLDDLLSMIPLMNSQPASDLLFDLVIEQFLFHLPPGVISMYTVRELITLFFDYLEASTADWFYTGDQQVWTNSILTVESDFTFLTTTDYSGNVNDLIGGSVSLNSNSYKHEIVNAVDLGAIINITLSPDFLNNLTDIGYSGGEGAIFYASSYMFDLNFSNGTLHEIIHEVVLILNYTTGTYIQFFNTFMAGGFPMEEGPNINFDFIMTSLETMGYIDNTIKLRVTIDEMGAVMTVPYIGYSGVPINITMEMSPDGVNWITIPIGVTSPGSMGTLPTAFLTQSDLFIIDPSTTPGGWYAALSQQIGMSFGLIMANTYDWVDLNSDVTIPAGFGITIPGLTFLQDLDEINFGISWTTEGLLDEAVIVYGGTQIIRIGTPVVTQQFNVPGYDLLITIGVFALGSLGVIYVIMKKKRV